METRAFRWNRLRERLEPVGAIVIRLNSTPIALPDPSADTFGILICFLICVRTLYDLFFDSDGPDVSPESRPSHGKAAIGPNNVAFALARLVFAASLTRKLGDTLGRNLESPWSWKA